MLDRTYIISRTLEDKIAIAENIGQNTMIVTLDVLKEILALLKEQKAIVRCKDCMYWSKDHDHHCMIKQGWFPVKPDWFCADGERE